MLASIVRASCSQPRVRRPDREHRAREHRAREHLMLAPELTPPHWNHATAIALYSSPQQQHESLTSWHKIAMTTAIRT